jgi:hypothetical protein
MSSAPAEPAKSPLQYYCEHLIYSAFGCGTVVALFLLFSPNREAFLHPFLLPVFAAGVLIGVDLLDWLTTRVPTFDPAGLLSVLAMHFFFVCPLLHVHWDLWMPYVTEPPDWRYWVAVMAWLNLAGVIFYQLTRYGIQNYFKHLTPQVAHEWRVSDRFFYPIAIFTLICCAGLQIKIIQEMGGIQEFLNASTMADNREDMQGMGSIFMISEAFPVLAMFVFARLARRYAELRSWWVILPVLAILFGMCLVAGGLRNSRASVVWNLFWFGGIVHFMIRPITKTTIFTGLGVLFFFMWAYGLVKNTGVQGLTALVDSELREQIQGRSQRKMDILLTGDMGRTDIQAFLLYRLYGTDDNDYEFAWGRTYVGGVTIIIPLTLFPNRPPTKAKWGTDIQYGNDYWIPYRRETSRVFGLAGEAILNFGAWSAPFSYIALGVLVALLREWQRRLPVHDIRYMIYAFSLSLPFFLLVNDSDLIVFHVFKNLTIPLIVILFSLEPTYSYEGS